MTLTKEPPEIWPRKMRDPPAPPPRFSGFCEVYLHLVKYLHFKCIALGVLLGNHPLAPPALATRDGQRPDFQSRGLRLLPRASRERDGAHARACVRLLPLSVMLPRVPEGRVCRQRVVCFSCIDRLAVPRPASHPTTDGSLARFRFGAIATRLLGSLAHAFSLLLCRVNFREWNRRVVWGLDVELRQERARSSAAAVPVSSPSAASEKPCHHVLAHAGADGFFVSVLLVLMT